MPEDLDITNTIAVALALALCVLPLYILGARNKLLALCMVIPVGAALFYGLLTLLGVLGG